MSEGDPREAWPRKLFLDLENLVFLADSLQHLSFACRLNRVEFRSYCSPKFDLASRATHFSRSNEKEAADVKIVCDAAVLASKLKNLDILLITDDLFGLTLAAELAAVTHATYSSTLPYRWKELLRKSSLEEYFEAIDVYRERRSQTPSEYSGVSRSHSRNNSTRALWSRAASVMTEAGKKGESTLRNPRPTARPSGAKLSGPRKWPKGTSPSPGKQIGTIIRWFASGRGPGLASSGRTAGMPTSSFTSPKSTSNAQPVSRTISCIS